MADLRQKKTSTFATLFVLLTLAACAAGPPVADRSTEQSLDPEVIWQRADQQHSAAVQAVAERQQLQNDYAAVIRLSRDGDLRGQALMRLAEISIVLGEYEEAKQYLTQSMRAELTPQHRSQALLLLADLLERHIGEQDAAVKAYRQVMIEYPASPEAQLARLRMEAIDHEQR